MGDPERTAFLSTVLAAVAALAAVIWLLPLAVGVAWQIIPSVLILIIIIGAIRGIVGRFFE